MTSETNSTLKIESIHILLKHYVYETNVTRTSFVKIEGFILFYFFHSFLLSCVKLISLLG